MNKIAQYLSIALHPYFVPVYAMLVLLFTANGFGSFPFAAKFYIVWVVALYMAVIPFLLLALLKSIGRLRSWSVNERRERIVPLAVGIVSAVLCAVTFAQSPSLDLFRRFMVAAACCQAVCLVVTLYWKISLHMVTMGAVAAIFFIMDIAAMGDVMWAFVLTVFLSGALASARLQLGAHNLTHVSTGFVAGFVTAFFAVLYL